MHFQPDTWTTGDVFTNPKGGKSVNIVCGGETPKFRFATPENPITSPYGTSSWDPGATRLSIAFVLNDDLRTFDQTGRLGEIVWQTN